MVVRRRHYYMFLIKIAVSLRIVQDVRHRRDLDDQVQASSPSVRWLRFVKGVPPDEDLVSLIWPSSIGVSYGNYCR